MEYERNGRNYRKRRGVFDRFAVGVGFGGVRGDGFESNFLFSDLTF